MIDGTRVVVVVPAFRVLGRIERVLEAMPAIVDAIVVVDDASPDDVGSVISELRMPRVLVVRNERNLGVGGATVTGFKAAMDAGADIVVKCDGDGQMDPGDIPKLLLPILEGRADHVKASRLRHFQALRTMPWLRFVGNVGLTFLAKIATGYWNVVDPVNGFVATRAQTLKRLPLDRLSRRYFFETDLLGRLNEIEARVEEVPLPARYGGEESSLSSWKELFRFPPLLAVCLVRRVFWRYLFYDVSPVAVFGLSGVTLMAFGFVFGVVEWMKNGLRGVPTPLGSIMLAALPAILGFQALLQAVAWDIQAVPRPGLRQGPGDGNEIEERRPSGGADGGR